MELPPADLDRLLGVRDVVVVEGPDAQTYLHSQVSQDLTGMTVGEQRWTFVLEPSGKVQSLARVTRAGDERFELDTDHGFGEALRARIDRFKIRVKAETSIGEQYGRAAEEHERITVGWPRLGAELMPGETLVAGTGLAGIAVSSTKGCYPGQELVERMASRAADAPRSIRRLSVEPGTEIGDAVLDGGDEVGIVTSVAGDTALGWVKRTSQVGTIVQF